MFNTCRWYFRYGNEDDPMDCTFKEFDTIEKAIKYARRYATGIRFCGVEIEDSDRNLLFEIDSNFEETDYRKVVKYEINNIRGLYKRKRIRNNSY